MRSFSISRQASRTLRTALRSSPRPSPIRPIFPIATASTPFHTCSPRRKRSDAPSESQPTNFSDLDVLGGAPIPSTSVDVCMSNGFALNSGVTITDGDGALLVNGEAFSWRPWEVTGEKRILNKKGQVHFDKEALGLLDILWPRPGTLLHGDTPTQIEG